MSADDEQANARRDHHDAHERPTPTAVRERADERADSA